MAFSKPAMIALLILAAICLHRTAAAAIPVKLRVTLTEQLDYDGTIGYKLYGGGGVLFPRTELLTTPTGVQIPEFDSLRFSTWSELVAASVGEWKFISTSRTDPADSEEYRFTVSAPNYADMSPQFPVVSPASGSVVTSPLVISWSPLTDGYSGGASNVASFKSTRLEPTKVEYAFGRSYSSDARLRFATAQDLDLSALVSAVVPPATDPLYDATAVLTFSRQTATQYIPADAVPEPSTGVIAMLLPLGLALTRRYR